MKYAMFATLLLFSAFASANDNTQAPQASQYRYGDHLDIAHVVSITPAQNINDVCSPVDQHMIYVDHQGVTHDMTYTVMGNGCQNG